MYDKVYLIDSENISDEWADILDRMGQQDAIFVFYTDKSAHISCQRVCKLMQQGAGRVWWIKCFEGNNALDFQLVSELGAMIGREAAFEYVIISKDNGYNSVVKYWNDRGITLSRQGAKWEEKEEKKPESAVCSGAGTGEAEECGRKHPIKDGFTRELLKSVDIMDNTLLYAVLTAFEGQDAGAECYRQLRDMGKENKEEIRELLLKDRQKRGINYMRLLLGRNGMPAEDAEGLYKNILEGSKKNKDKYRKALIGKYGQESGERYYRVTKAHYNYVKKI